MTELQTTEQVTMLGTEQETELDETELMETEVMVEVKMELQARRLTELQAEVVVVVKAKQVIEWLTELQAGWLTEQGPELRATEQESELTAGQVAELITTRAAEL